MSEIPYNMNIVTDNDLREVPEESAEMEKGVAFLLERSREAGDETSKALYLAKAGLFSRVLDKLEKSEEYITEAIKLLKKNDLKKQAADLRLRLAVTHVYMSKFTEAEKIFTEVIQKANSKQPADEGLNKLKELALMGLGKSKFEQKMYQGAIRNFSEAGEMKVARGDTAGFSKCNEAQKIAQSKINIATGATSSQAKPDNYIDPLLNVIDELEAGDHNDE